MPGATVGAIALVTTFSAPMAGTLFVVGAVMIVVMFRLAAAGKPLHHEFADKAAAVDGEMVDVIGNMPMVRAFCGIRREHSRFDQAVDREMTSRRRSLFYLEKLRLTHALITIVLTVCLLAWAIERLVSARLALLVASVSVTIRTLIPVFCSIATVIIWSSCLEPVPAILNWLACPDLTAFMYSAAVL